MPKPVRTSESPARSARKPAARSSIEPARTAAPRRRKTAPKSRKVAPWHSSPLVFVGILLVGLVLWIGFFRDSDTEWVDEPIASEAQLASFRHPSTLSAEEVDALRRTYIDNYKSIARREMKRFGIPASITLAQGLLESVAGTSRLATETNNHFGMKCFSRSCPKGHCRNFSDDHHKDFFRNYQHPKESFRAHSEFLEDNDRYNALFKLSKRDHVGWAQGLAKAGYATDTKYGDKLISLIKRYELNDYDR